MFNEFSMIHEIQPEPNFISNSLGCHLFELWMNIFHFSHH